MNKNVVTNKVGVGISSNKEGMAMRNTTDNVGKTTDPVCKPILQRVFSSETCNWTKAKRTPSCKHNAANAEDQRGKSRKPSSWGEVLKKAKAQLQSWALAKTQHFL